MAQARPSRPTRVSRGVPFSIRLTAELSSFLKAEAAKEHRPMSNLIERILEDYREARYAADDRSWDDFWASVHETSRQQGLDRMSEDEIVAEVRAARQTRTYRRRRD